MGKSKKTPEADILATKWHNAQVNNDAHHLQQKGITSPDVSLSYACAYNKDLKMWRYFSTKARLEKFKADPVQSAGFKIFTKN